MPKYPKKLEETALWKLYVEKVSEQDSNRRLWVKKVYENAVTYLKHVGDTFPNYTLHDETHVLNIMYAMGALLGDQIECLSVGEVELLILVACLHDIGMVYDEADRERAFNDERKCRRFLQENAPDLIGTSYTDWPESTRQWYLRTLHPFRLPEILSTEEWRNLFDDRPREIVPEQIIVTVCQSHGEEPKAIKNNDALQYLPAHKIDPLFCVMLLRLADLLDFDDTRAPQILFKYAGGSEGSVKEWTKHMASMGFSYSRSPSNNELIFSAECKEPGEEYSIREFLDWIDDEFSNCNKLKEICHNDWQSKFLFPLSISREGITSVGYVSHEFKITMDQNQILKLLTGENLYNSNDVFVRELLQNAVDATLLRDKMDTNFKIEEARIDLWEWSDQDGSLWFRIDDQGTGMTLGILEKYFLKVGNSYYTSKELKKDLSNYSNDKNFYGISRFGIGFLSCFLCGIEAEVSTLYFDDNKSKVLHNIDAGDRNGYGLRMHIPSLSGYYTLKSQAENHIINNLLPAPEFMNSVNHPRLEYNGYRSMAGTSIVIKLDPGKLETMDLKVAAEKYVCGTPIQIFYNGEKIGYTYSEIMKKAHEFAGENIYELSDKEKAEYDKTFPSIKGRYPKIAISVIPLDTEEYRLLSNFSGILVKYDVNFEDSLQWKFMDQVYTIDVSLPSFGGERTLLMHATNVKESSDLYFEIWDRLRIEYGDRNIYTLKETLRKFTKCPVSEKELGDSWLPFAEKENISEIWQIFVDEQQSSGMQIILNDNFVTLTSLTHHRGCSGVVCAYQGIFTGNLGYTRSRLNLDLIFFLKDKLQPDVDVGRTKILGLSLDVVTAIYSIICYFNYDDLVRLSLQLPNNMHSIALPEWRRLHDTELGKWLLKTQNERVTQIQEFLQTPLKPANIYDVEEHEYNLLLTSFQYMGLKILYKFATAYFQDAYDLTIQYENGQTITFSEKRKMGCDNSWDMFPPMMFCKAGSEESRAYLCCSSSIQRRCITSDHPFAQWLVENAVMLDRHFPRQFQQIVYSLCNCDVQEIIEIVNDFRQQLIRLKACHGINIHSLHDLTKDDFWKPSL